MTWSGALSYMCFLQEAQIRLLFEEHRGTQACARLVAAEMGPAWKASSITRHLRKLGLSRRAQSAERAAVFSVRVLRHTEATFAQALISTKHSKHSHVHPAANPGSFRSKNALKSNTAMGCAALLRRCVHIQPLFACVH